MAPVCGHWDVEGLCPACVWPAWRCCCAASVPAQSTGTIPINNARILSSASMAAHLMQRSHGPFHLPHHAAQVFLELVHRAQGFLIHHHVALMLHPLHPFHHVPHLRRHLCHDLAHPQHDLLM